MMRRSAPAAAAFGPRGEFIEQTPETNDVSCNVYPAGTLLAKTCALPDILINDSAVCQVAAIKHAVEYAGLLATSYRRQRPKGCFKESCGDKTCYYYNPVECELSELNIPAGADATPVCERA